MSSSTPPPVSPAGAVSHSELIEGWRVDYSTAPAIVHARTRRIAILGFGATAKDTPVSDATWELWAMNGFWRAAKPDFGLDIPEERYGLWFDMHTIEYTREYGVVAKIGDAQERWLEQRHPFPIYMLEENAAFPSVRAYPIEELVAQLGRDYFTSSVAYALALALAQPDVAEIGLWGIDLVHSTEYGDQRPCAEYWIGRAEAAGITVTIHEKSALLKQHNRYGYEVPNELEREVRSYLDQMEQHLGKSITDRVGEMEKLRQQAQSEDGALQAVRNIKGRLDIWSRGGRI